MPGLGAEVDSTPLRASLDLGLRPPSPVRCPGACDFYNIIFSGHPTSKPSPNGTRFSPRAHISTLLKKGHLPNSLSIHNQQTFRPQQSLYGLLLGSHLLLRHHLVDLLDSNSGGQLTLSTYFLAFASYFPGSGHFGLAFGVSDFHGISLPTGLFAAPSLLSFPAW